MNCENWSAFNKVTSTAQKINFHSVTNGPFFVPTCILLIILYSDDVSSTTKVTDLITEHPTRNSPLK